MSEFDTDIASLLDDVLNDKEQAPEPEVVTTPEVPAPPQPDVDTPADERCDTDEALSPEQQLAAMLGEDDPTPEPATVESPADVTSLVTSDRKGSRTPDDKHVEELATSDADVKAASLPPVDNSMFSEEVDEPAIPVPSFTSDEIMESLDIRNFGTLVSLATQRWHAKVKDRKAAKDAAAASGADAASFEARKRLLVGADEKLKRVHKTIDAARTEHYAMTLPWSTVGINDKGKRAGSRLLPNTLFFDYTMKMGQHKAEMTEALEEFVAAYPTLIAISQQKLGTSFNQNDYPPPASIEKHFDLTFDFDPIPSGGDFGGLQEAQCDKLAASLQRKTQQKLENAMQDAWLRLEADVSHAAAVLGNPDSMFHYTLVEKLRAHADMLQHLNATKDPRIETIRAEVKNKLCKFDPKDIRKDDALRKTLAGYADEILAAMKEHSNAA